MTIYTIIAYRENGVDYTRGNIYGESDSAFDYICTKNIKKAAAFCAEKNYKSANSDKKYCSWELTYLIDGMDEDSWWNFNDKHTGDTPFDQLFAAITEDETTLLMVRKEEEKRIKAEQERIRKAEEAERLRQLQEQKERAEFERLSKKYGKEIEIKTT